MTCVRTRRMKHGLKHVLKRVGWRVGERVGSLVGSYLGPNISSKIRSKMLVWLLASPAPASGQKSAHDVAESCFSNINSAGRLPEMPTFNIECGIPLWLHQMLTQALAARDSVTNSPR